MGARVRVVAGERARVAEVRAGSGYLSVDDPRLLFGLGREGRPALVQIRWPGGGRGRFRGLEPGRYYHVPEGEEEP